MASSFYQRPWHEPAVPLAPSFSQTEAPKYHALLYSDRSSQDRELGSEEYEPGEIQLSEDEESSPDPSPSVGLFDPALFKSLLLKASTAAKIDPEPKTQPPPTSQGSTPLFSETVVTQKYIPCPAFFHSMVQKQWAMPGNLPTPGGTEKRLFNMAPSLSDMLEVLVVVDSLTPLFSSSAVSGDMAEALKAENRKSEYSLHRPHQASAWSVKVSTSTSFFARTSIIWLRELQSMIPPEQVRTHQNLDKLVATSEYMADASLHAARFSSRARASNVTARRLLWLRQ